MGSFLFLAAMLTNPALVAGYEREDVEVPEREAAVSALRPLWS